MGSSVELQKKVEDVCCRLIERGAATRGEILGCTSDEVEEVENGLGIVLPEAYRQFLLRMGRQSGRFFRGTDFLYPSIVGLTDDAREMLEDADPSLLLPHDAVVFSMHQGYQFMFMSGGAQDDPAVHTYVEGAGRFELVAGSFTEYLRSAALEEW